MVIINFQICIYRTTIFLCLELIYFTKVSIWKVSFCHQQENACNFDTGSLYEESVHGGGPISTPAYIPLNSESLLTISATSHFTISEEFISNVDENFLIRVWYLKFEL